jgi:hypothetical protein
MSQKSETNRYRNTTPSPQAAIQGFMAHIKRHEINCKDLQEK